MKLRDDYIAVMSSQNDWIDTIKDSENTSLWCKGIDASTLGIISVDEYDAMQVKERSAELSIDEAVLYDTCTGFEASRLCVTGGVTGAIRSCAIPSLLNTAKINGTALGKLSKKNLAAVLSMCLEVAKKNKTLVLIRDGKVNAFLTDVYDRMPQLELIEMFQKELINKFGSIKFISGFHSHALTGCDYELTTAQERIMKQYSLDDEYMPIVRFKTSDTGFCAATVLPVLRSKNGSNICLGKGIKIDHKRTGDVSAMQKFGEQLPQIYAKFIEFEEVFQRMTNVEINNPFNAALGMCKKCGLPTKYMNDA